ncbi:hypothetical protein N0V90_005306 [Kalmusia sp. IMI 367209]|nr:hypothetical protein N0V90_005306 [Kalmusia sp. IMI 367209]
MLQLANAWNDVGFVKLSYGDFEAALDYFLESHRIKQEHATEDHIPWHYGETFKNLALVKLHQGDKTGAEEAARRSCELCCQGRLETDASTQKARSLLAIVLMNTDKVDEALGLHKSVYKVRKEILGETNLHTKNTLYLIAELYRLKGKLVKAEDEAVARAKYHLALVIQARTDQLDATRRTEAKELIDNARKICNKLAPSPNNTLDAAEGLERFDFLVSLLAGRWIQRK